MAGNNRTQVVEYNPTGMDINMPESSSTRAIAYVRPEDVIIFNFDINDIKVEVIEGDVQIIFNNGSTITLASLASIGFSNTAPVLQDPNGNSYSLDQFLSKAEVLNYDEAILILTNRDEVKLVNTQPKVVKQASETEADLTAGTPITGDGVTDTVTKGMPSSIIDTQGRSKDTFTYSGKGAFAQNNFNSNKPFNQDNDKNKPGTSHAVKEPSVKTSIMYGSVMERSEQITMNDITYTPYKFKSGPFETDDPTNMLIKKDIKDTSNQNLFVVNRTDKISYGLKLNYGGGVDPISIAIFIPKSVADKISLDPSAGGALIGPPILEPDGSLKYNVSGLTADKIINGILSVTADIPDTRFELKYQMTYIDEASGLEKITDITQAVAVTAVRRESDLNKLGDIKNIRLLSSSPSPINVESGTGNDIILTGSSGSNVNSAGGDNKIFTGAGDDTIYFGNQENNKIWGSLGYDIIKGTGNAGNNTVYYNNFKDNIDSTNVNFKDEYYNTLPTTNIPLSLYLGYDKETLSSLLQSSANQTKKTAMQNEIEDGSLLVNKSSSSGADILTKVSNVFFSNNNNTLYVSDKYAATTPGIIYNITGYSSAPSNASTASSSSSIYLYTINLDGEKFTGDSIVNIQKSIVQSSISSNEDNVVLKFTNFNVFEGRANQGDTFIAGINPLFNIMTINGKNSEGNKVHYSEMDTSLLPGSNNHNQGIIFQAAAKNRAIVYKGGTTSPYRDNIINIQHIKGTVRNDTFISDYVSSYTFDGNTGDNKVDYSKVTTGIRYDVGAQKVYKTTGSDYLSSQQDTLININSIILTPSDDIISGDLSGSHDFNGGDGRDTLTYETIDGPIVYTLVSGNQNDKYGKATIVKSGGGTDTFDLSLQNGTKYVANISEVQGSKGDDTFNLDVFENASANMEYDGKGGKNTISYLGSKLVAGASGVKFYINGDKAERSSVYRKGGIDFFKNITNLEGSKGDDTISFTDQITTFDSIKDYNVDLSSANSKNTVDFEKLNILQDIIKDANGKNGLKFTIVNGTVVVNFGYLKNPGNAEFEGDANNKLILKGVHNIVGSHQDNLFEAVTTGDYNFDGKGGENTADYMNVNTDIEFRLDINQVRKGGEGTDSLANITTILGSSEKRNVFYLDGNKNYKVIGNDSAGIQNVLGYQYSSKGMTFDFSNGRIYKGDKTAEEIAANPSSDYDSYDKIQQIRGSSYNDRYLAFESAEAKSVEVHGGSGTNTLDFSRIVSSEYKDLNLDLTYNPDNGQAQDITVANVTWHIKNHNGLFSINSVKGTKEGDNTFKVRHYKAGLSIDGGEKGKTSEGQNHLTYATDDSLGLDVSISDKININRRYVNDERYSDIAQNINKLTLSKNANDTLRISKDIIKSELNIIDANGYKKVAGSNDPEDIFANNIKFDNFETAADKVMTVNINAGLQVGVAYSLSEGLFDKQLLNFHSFDLGNNYALVNFTKEAFETDGQFGLKFEGGEVSHTKVTFKSVGVVTLDLNQSAGEKGSVIIKSTNKKIDTSFYNIETYEVVSDSYIYAIYNKSSVFQGADDNSKNNTLDYSKVGAEKQGILINLNQGRIYKGNSDNPGTDYDSYDKSFRNIKGSQGADTIRITDLTALSGSQGMNIDLGYNTPADGAFDNANGSNNTLRIDVDYQIYYNLTGGTLSDSENGTNSVDVSTIKGTSNLRLADNKRNVLLVKGFVSQSQIPYKLINGGSYDSNDPSKMNLIDASISDKYFMFDAFTGRLSPNGDNQWSSYKVVNVNHIKGSSVGASFLSYGIDSYLFEGYENTNNTLSYQKSTVGVTVNITGKGSGVVNKSGTNVDTYKNIKNFVGSNVHDDYKVTNSDITFLDGMTIQGNADILSEINNAILFDSSIENLTLDLTTESANWDKVYVSDGGIHNSSSFKSKNVNIYNFTNKVKNVTMVVQDALKQNVFAGADSSAFKMVYKNTTDDITFYAEDSKVIRGSYTDSLKGLSILEFAGSKKSDINGAYNRNHTYISSSTGEMNISYATANTNFGGINVDFSTNANGCYTINKGSNYKDLVKNASSITGITGKTNLYSIIDHSGDQAWKVVTIKGSALDIVSFEKFYGDPSTDTARHDFTSNQLSNFSKYGYNLINISNYKLTGKGTFKFQANDTYKSYIIDGGFRREVETDNTFDYTDLGRSPTTSFVFSKPGTVTVNKQYELEGSKVINTDSLSHVDKIIGVKNGNDNYQIGSSIQLAGIQEYDKSGTGYTNTIDFGKVINKLIFKYNDGVIDVTEEGPGNNNYNQIYQYFSDIKVSRNSEVHVSTLSEAKPVKFSAPSGSTAIFYVGDTPGVANIYINYVKTGITSLSFNKNSNSAKIAELLSFGGVKTDGSSTAIHVNKKVTETGIFEGNENQYTNSITYQPGGSGDLVFLNTSEATYHSPAMGNGNHDQLKNIYIYNLNNASGNAVTIAAREAASHKIVVNAGTGGNNSVILGAGYQNVTLDFSASGLDGVISGYDLQNFQSYTLSTGDDTVYIDDVTDKRKNSYILDGGGSVNKNDRIFYTKVTKDINVTFDVAPAGKLYDTFAIDKTEGLTDILSRFNRMYLNKDVKNTFDFKNYSHAGEYFVDFGEGSTKGTANFSSSLISGTFIFDTNGAMQANFSKGGASNVVFNFNNLTNFVATTFDDKFSLNSEKNYGNLNIRGNLGRNTIEITGSKDTTFHLQNGSIQTTTGKLLSFSEVEQFVGSSAAANTFLMSDKDSNNNIVNYNVDGGGISKNNTADFSNISISDMNFVVKKNQIDASTSSNSNILKNISTVKLSLTAQNVIKITEKGNYYNNELSFVGGTNSENTMDFTEYGDYSGGKINLNYDKSRAVADLDGVDYMVNNFTTVNMVAGSAITVNMDTVNFNKIQNFVSTYSNSAPNAFTIFNLKNSSGNIQSVSINLSSNLIEYSSSQIKLHGAFKIDVDPVKSAIIKIIDPSQVQSNVIFNRPADGVTNTLDLTGLILANGSSSYLLNIEYSYTNNSMHMKLDGTNGNQIINVTDLVASNASATMLFTRNNSDIDGVTSIDKLRNVTAGAAADQTLRIDSALSSTGGEGGAIVIDDTGIVLGQDKSDYFDGEKITAGYMRFKNFKSIIAENNSNENVHVRLNSGNIGKLSNITLATAANTKVIHQMNLSSMKSAISLLMDQSSVAYLNVTGGRVSSADAQNTIKLNGFNYIYLSKGHNHTITVKDIQTNIHLYSDTQSSVDVKTSYIVTDNISNVYLTKKTILGHQEIGFYVTKNGARNPETSTDGIMLPNALSLSSPNEIGTVNFIIGRSPFFVTDNSQINKYTVTFEDLNNTTQTINSVKNINLFGWWTNLKGTLELGKTASFIIEKSNAATNSTFKNTINMTFTSGVTGTLINLVAPYLVQHAVSSVAFQKDMNILSAAGYITSGVEINTSITIKQGLAAHKPVIIMPMVSLAKDDSSASPQRAHGRSEIVVTYPKKNTSVELIYTKGDQIEGLSLSSDAGMIGVNIKNTSDNSNITVYNTNNIILENGGFLNFNQSFIDLIKSRLTPEIDSLGVWGWDRFGEANAFIDKTSLSCMHVIDRSGTAVFNYPVISSYGSNSHIDGSYYIIKDSSGVEQAKVEVYNFLYFKADTSLNSRSSGVSYDIGTEHIMKSAGLDPNKQPLYMDEAKEVVIHDVRDGAIVNGKEDTSVSFANQGLTAHWTVGNKDIEVKIGGEEYTLKKADYLIIQNEDKTRTMYVNKANESNLENNPIEQRDDSLNDNGNWNVHDSSSMHHEIPATPQVTEEDVSGSSGYDPHDPHNRSH